MSVILAFVGVILFAASGLFALEGQMTISLPFLLIACLSIGCALLLLDD